MRLYFTLLFITSALFGGSISNSTRNHIYEVGETVIPFTLLSQREKKHWIDNNTQYIFITYSKNATALQNRYVIEHGGNKFLQQNNILLIVDVSVIPAGILTLFVRPKLESFDHPLLLSYDENFSRMFPYKEEHIAIMKVEKRIVKEIVYCSDEVCLDSLFKK